MRKMAMPRAILVLWALLPAAAALAAPALAKEREPSVRAIAPAEPVAVPAGGAAEVEIAIALAAGYHVYGENASSYVPLRIAAQEGSGFAASARFPAPRVKELLGEKVPVYEGRIPVRARATSITLT